MNSNIVAVQMQPWTCSIDYLCLKILLCTPNRFHNMLPISQQTRNIFNKKNKAFINRNITIRLFNVNEDRNLYKEKT